MKLKEVFEKSVQFFKDKKIESARLDTELLLASALKIDRLQIYIRYDQPLSESEVSICRELIRRRGMGEPVAYILGYRGFYGELYSVGPGVLIPRPETEAIVEQALDHIIKNKITEPRILDLGAGTGCIGFSILKNSINAKLISIEQSPQAFEFLVQNQKKLDLTERSELILGDVNAYLAPTASFDIVVANPPYIDITDVAVEAAVRKFEPAEALFASEEGLKSLKEWSSRFAPIVKKNGLMLFEMGHLQAEKMKEHFVSLNIFSDVQILKDLSGLDRIIKAHNNN